MKNSVCLILTFFIIFDASTRERMNIDMSQPVWNITLDPEAQWKNDVLFLPPADVSALSVHSPTQGWDVVFNRPDTSKIPLPATVEEYFWGWNGQTFGVTGNYLGVSWFTAKVFIPREWEGKRMVMQVAGVRFRAEIFVNRKLVGYDVVNSTPFDVDLTDCLTTGAENEIAFRITDPNGNFNWKDSQVYTWGDYDTNPSHGFGGITGPVTLQATEKLYTSSVFIKNCPDPREIETEIIVENGLGGDAQNKKLRLEICEYDSGKKVYAEERMISVIPQGKSLYTCKIKVPDAKLWSVDEPNLYQLNVFVDGDELSERFGFRWFEVRTVNGDRQFYLNGKRIVLRSAISWGYWPDNGIAPTDEYARKQILAAKRLGLNMLSFHRAIGQKNVLDDADELGLLFWEEPGGNQYPADRQESGDPKARFYMNYRNEKLARMIVRDRNHPSLVIYNLHNERGADPQAEDYREMRMAHELDPTRQINYNSCNGANPEGVPNVRFKLHLMPYDTTFYDVGWYDRHHAGGPGVYHDNLYHHPKDYLRYSDNKSEIIYWGEEGAIGTPPRLEKIRSSILETKKYNGWEAADYLAWYDAYDRFLHTRGFDKAFPTVDDLTVAMGNVSFYYQGRVIENIRINNTVDGYAVNGWESMKLENHSGIVDNYRNLKGDPDLIARYNAPLFLSVKLNHKVLAVGDTVTADIFIVNEKNIRGKFILTVTVKDDSGKVQASFTKKVTISGGVTYGENLLTGLKFVVPTAGYTTVKAEMKAGKDLTVKGDDQIFAVKPDVKNIPVNGLVADTTGIWMKFMNRMGVKVKKYEQGVPSGDYLLIGAFEPQQWGSGMSDIIEWVWKGGSLIIVDNPVRWAEFLADKEVLDFRGYKELGRSWYGGNFFNRAHPVFDGLPVDCVFNWEYQCFSAYNRRRIGLRTGSGETLAGCVSDHRKEVYSALSLIPTGRGKIIITTLDIPACVKQVARSDAPVDIDGMDEAMGTFNPAIDNPANIVGQQLLFNLIKEAVKR
ncbi:MAG: beta-glycosidase [Candidatus Azobacteroides sp.]|nr:beta-glycosidase [Candidatus Azobacteroides sp.]